MFSRKLSALLIAPVLLGVLAGSALAQKPHGGAAPVFNPQIVNCPVGPTRLCVPLDNTFDTVPFGSNLGCSGAADPADPCRRNDDDSSILINLPFTFNLYGAPYTTCYTNNNGNISFDQPYCDYSPFGFPLGGFPMVAPFWSDVDTRDALSGVVSYRIEPHRMIVTWDHVGYFFLHTDKLNTFQVIISDGTDPLVGLGNNVCFCYDDMQWTTGDASGGVGGVGGSPATVGVNKGDGVNFFQIGRFDHPGIDYDGPGGSVDGVDYLDGRQFCFNVAVGDNNIPPIGQGFPPNNHVDVCFYDVLVLHTGFASPEVGQTTTTLADLMGLANASVVSTPGNPSLQTLTYSPTLADVGPHLVRYTATDDGVPPATTIIDLTINVTFDGCPTPARRATWGRLKTLYR